MHEMLSSTNNLGMAFNEQYCLFVDKSVDFDMFEGKCCRNYTESHIYLIRQLRNKICIFKYANSHKNGKNNRRCEWNEGWVRLRLPTFGRKKCLFVSKQQLLWRNWPFFPLNCCQTSFSNSLFQCFSMFVSNISQLTKVIQYLLEFRYVSFGSVFRLSTNEIGFGRWQQQDGIVVKPFFYHLSDVGCASKQKIVT